MTTPIPKQIALSFIIPVKNGERFIGQCLTCILSEIEPQDEIIVVDNGSSDRTADIAYGFARVEVISTPNSTISAARNLGAKSARGDLYVFIDCDVLVTPGYRHEVLRVLGDTKIVATGSRYDLPENPHWVEKVWFSQKLEQPGPVKYINSGNLIVRQEAYRAVGGFDEAMVTDEDYDLCRRLRDSGYLVWEDSAIRGIHLGNPKSLKQFYHKQRWHTSILADKKAWQLDRPMIMTLVFLMTILLAVAGFVLGLLHNSKWFLLLLAPVVPSGMTTLARIIQYRSFKYPIRITVLYSVYYAARLSVVGRALVSSKR